MVLSRSLLNLLVASVDDSPRRSRKPHCRAPRGPGCCLDEERPPQSLEPTIYRRLVTVKQRKFTISLGASSFLDSSLLVVRLKGTTNPLTEYSLTLQSRKDGVEDHSRNGRLAAVCDIEKALLRRYFHPHHEMDLLMVQVLPIQYWCRHFRAHHASLL